MSAERSSNRSSWDGRKGESIDKAVMDVFDELFTEISAKIKLHYSEQINRDNRASGVNGAKLYDFVNSYHAFCKLCDQHFYSRSVPDDINSFFQKHLNTSYHRQFRAAGFCPDDVPMFTWEETLHSAKCNVCDLSGLYAFVNNTKTCIKKLMHQHICFWPTDQRETNEKFLRKLNVLKKYCSLKFFRDKFLKTVCGREVCLLCMVSLPWSKDRASSHLRSDTHYQKFCMFVWTNFNFAPKDILNGFNLEAVTRWLITYEPPLWTNFVDLNELATCLNHSNSCVNPYPEDKKNLSYSPVYVKALLIEKEIDFVHQNKCLVCNVEAKPGHFNSSMHRANVVGFGENSFTSKNYAIYLKNREKRLVPYLDVIESYERLLEEVKKQAMPPPISSHYFESLFANKLSLVEEVIVRVDRTELFCHVCDQYLKKWRQNAHLASDGHNSQVEKWAKLREDFASEKFLEPFAKIGNLILCLLCGSVLYTNNFFSHLKSGMHVRKQELYKSLDVGIPISSAFKFLEDFSCFCLICDSPLSENKSLKAMLKDMRCHWPCPKINQGRKSLTGEMEVVIQEDEDLAEAMACLFEEDGDKTEVEISRVAKRPETIESVLDGKITNSGLVKPPNLKSRNGNPMLPESKATARVAEGRRPHAVGEGSVSDSDQGLGLTCCGSPTGAGDRAGKKAGEEKKKPRSDLMDGDGRSEEEEEKDVEEEERDVEEEINEVLVIRGLPKKKRKWKIIYSLFEVFGKILYVTMNSKAVVVAFAERGIANAAAVEARKVLQEPQVGVMVSERKSTGKKRKTVEELLLDKKLIDILRDPPRLMDFMLCLVFQATSAPQSPVETQREETVCNTIIRAVMEKFPCCRCYPFGSRLTGLSTTTSDLDVFLDCGGMYEGFKNTSPSAEKKLVRTVATALRKVGDVTDIIVVDRARVPIVSFHHKPTNLDCDISFKNGLSIQNSLLIKFLVSLDWRVKPMILFMKYWAKQNGLHGPPYFSSYALSMLVINYLEQLESPVLPTIESLQNSYAGHRVTIGGWDCSINTNKSSLPKLHNKDPLPVLVAGLFEYYSTFDFNNDVVFPLTGKALPREAFSDSGKGKLPMCFKRHILNLPLPIENLVSDRFPICIVDPFDLSHILTKSFTFQGLMQFTYFCQMSSQYLKAGTSGCQSR